MTQSARPVAARSRLDAQRSIFETGEVLEPRIAVDRTTVPTLTGLVHFDDELELTRISTSVRTSDTEADAIVVEITPADEERVEIQLNGRPVYFGYADQGPFLDQTLCVADLDGSDDEASWLHPGYTLTQDDVAYIRTLLLPSTVARLPER